MYSEPVPATDPSLLDILNELTGREPIFHRAELGTKRSDFGKMTDAGFWETGASGKRYSREYVLDLLEQRHANGHDDQWETSEFRLQRLAEDVYLLTYTLLQDETRKTRRATIWRLSLDGWKIVYHQGTLVQDHL